ncbi:uncharacterized protein LOC132757614 [Ruditapes philippinarum]|uniref:uncharacterized protein LOC132757614 n=1 Tax=Ruditapes philippinarum TaxID=129788 RepID=UPI00295C24E2|nr:uncharacterized protein LOC132757614 [Ruditapes philippinarum]
MKEIHRQQAKLVDQLLVKSPTEIKNAKDTISDSKPLKENKFLNIKSDVGATDKSIQSTIVKVLTSDIKSDERPKPIFSDTIVDRATANESDTLYVVPDTFGDFLDIESDDSFSIDVGAVDEMSDSYTLADVLVIEVDVEIIDITESDDEIVDFEPIALQDDQDEAIDILTESDDDIVDFKAIALQDQEGVDITAARNDIDDTYITYNDIVDDDDNLFGIMDIYIKSDLHVDLQIIPTSAEHCDKRKDFGYKFFSFSTFFK